MTSSGRALGLYRVTGCALTMGSVLRRPDLQMERRGSRVPQGCMRGGGKQWNPGPVDSEPGRGPRGHRLAYQTPPTLTPATENTTHSWGRVRTPGRPGRGLLGAPRAEPGLQRGPGDGGAGRGEQRRSAQPGCAAHYGSVRQTLTTSARCRAPDRGVSAQRGSRAWRVLAAQRDEAAQCGSWARRPTPPGG